MANRVDANETERSMAKAAATDAMAAPVAVAPPRANRFRKAAAALVSATVVASLIATGAAVQPEPQAYAATSSQTSVSKAQKNLDAAIATAKTAKSNYETAREQASSALSASNDAYSEFISAQNEFDAAQRAYDKLEKPSENAQVIKDEQAVASQIKKYQTTLDTYDKARQQTANAETALENAVEALQRTQNEANIRAVTAAIDNLRKALKHQKIARAALLKEADSLAESVISLSHAWQQAFGSLVTNPATSEYRNSARKLAKSVKALGRADAKMAVSVGTELKRAGAYVTAVIKVVNYQHDYNQAKAQQQTTKKKGEADVSGSTYRKLKAKATKTTSSTVTVSWKKVSGATSYVIYGNKCGKNTKLKYRTTVGSKTGSYTQRNRKKATYYKYVVQALNAKGKVIATSKTVHAATTGGKVGNDTSVKVAKTKKALKTGKYLKKLSLKKGKSTTLHAKAVPQNKKTVKRHRGLRFESSKPSVAKVGAKSGKLTAKKKGSATVYCYTQNGKAATVKVTVK